MIQTIRELQVKIGNTVQPFVLLVLRIIIGYGFLRAGMDKFADIPKFVGIFEYLGIPMAELNVKISATFEVLSGALIFFGLATRIATVMGLGVMAVAIFTAHLHQVSQFFTTPGEFMAAAAIPYTMLFLVFFTYGPGKFSVDRLIGLEKLDERSQVGDGAR